MCVWGGGGGGGWLCALHVGMREDACPRSYPKSIFPPQASLKQLSYLLDVHTFSPEDVSLNQTTLTWPSKLSPIFEENEQVCEGEGGGREGVGI